MIVVGIDTVVFPDLDKGRWWCGTERRKDWDPLVIREEVEI